VKRIEEICGESLGISESDLANARIEDVHSKAKAEAL
jgi:hypothetical protein